jgi:hypothetical protein
MKEEVVLTRGSSSTGVYSTRVSIFSGLALAAASNA